jgi:hypothetical protein
VENDESCGWLIKGCVARMVYERNQKSRTRATFEVFYLKCKDVIKIITIWKVYTKRKHNPSVW